MTTRDMFGHLTVSITREQLESWAGRTLTDDEVYRLDDCVPDSSIPDAIDAIVSERMPTPDEDEDDDEGEQAESTPA
ncbi:hypothetical protein [Micromonospora sp. NPDC048839]|uniref:hypothetical protein n=1 Tax=Micromonospora sp. NPDC048839 TaxID=3155641 RepID=UPI00340342B7